MSKIITVRGFINQRLSAAAEEIFELFERTIAEYEEQLCRSKEENKRQKKRLDAVYNPEVRLHRADVQQLLVSPENVPCGQKDRGPGLDQEDPPEPPHVKDEEEELWNHQETEQLHGLKEEETTEFLLTPVPARTEEEEPQSSQLHQNQNKEILDSESETDDSSFYQDEFDKPESGLNHVSDRGGKSVETVVSSSECATSSDQKETESDATKIQNNKKTFSCSVCGKCFRKKSNFSKHQKTHKWVNGCTSGLNHLQKKAAAVSEVKCDAGKNLKSSSKCASSSEQKKEPQKQDKPFCCSVCKKNFIRKQLLQQHTLIHTGEKRHVCSVCGKRFLHRRSLTRHVYCHSGEKPFHCSVCGKSYAAPDSLKLHSIIHSGENPNSCTQCGKRFLKPSHLKEHFAVHLGEKPYKCKICDSRFSFRRALGRHALTHTGEKPYKCSVCNAKYARSENLKKHKEAKHSKERTSLQGS